MKYIISMYESDFAPLANSASLDWSIERVPYNNHVIGDRIVCVSPLEEILEALKPYDKDFSVYIFPALMPDYWVIEV